MYAMFTCVNLHTCAKNARASTHLAALLGTAGLFPPTQPPLCFHRSLTTFHRTRSDRIKASYPGQSFSLFAQSPSHVCATRKCQVRTMCVCALGIPSSSQAKKQRFYKGYHSRIARIRVSYLSVVVFNMRTGGNQVAWHWGVAPRWFLLSTWLRTASLHAVTDSALQLFD